MSVPITVLKVSTYRTKSPSSGPAKLRTFTSAAELYGNALVHVPVQVQDILLLGPLGLRLVGAAVVSLLVSSASTAATAPAASAAECAALERHDYLCGKEVLSGLVCRCTGGLDVVGGTLEGPCAGSFDVRYHVIQFQMFRSAWRSKCLRRSLLVSAMIRCLDMASTPRIVSYSYCPCSSAPQLCSVAVRLAGSFHPAGNRESFPEFPSSTSMRDDLGHYPGSILGDQQVPAGSRHVLRTFSSLLA